MDNRLPPNSEKFHLAPPDNRPPPNQLNAELRPGFEHKDRKLQKADREKLRRDRLNEQFTELGKTLDPDRPKFDKATILCDTIQMLNDLTAQVSRLKSEYTTLTEESRELTQEKHDLREEKASLKSDIENLNLQYQQRVRASSSIYPWGGHMDQSVVMQPHPHPPTYPYPIPMQMPMPPMHHPPIQPYPFFGNQNPSNPCSTFFQYVSPPPVHQPSSRSHVSTRQPSKNKSSSGKNEDSNDVATELELKMPGSTLDQEGSGGESKLKKSHRKENSISDESSLSPSGCSSSHTVQASSSNSVVGGLNGNGGGHR